MNPIEQWSRFELAFSGPTEGNPFVDVWVTARFYQDENTIDVNGFYDGDGTYRVRFMPTLPGTWKYVTKSNVAELTGRRGELEVVPPTGDNHGPVRVHDTFHFAYADGKPYKQIGTTCYVWTHQSNELQEQTLATLAASPFNKLRMCVFPKWYDWNRTEPQHYAFEGTPPLTWDFQRFNPAFFQHLEQRIDQLAALGIEADIILLHPYDEGHWGFDRMPAQADDFYLKYIVSRLASFRNVWWSLANEYDFMEHKKESDWDRFFQIVTHHDPYGHLTSIHNGFQIYDHNKPWVTHASIQNGSAVEDAGRAILYRDVYRKPVIFDEVGYEGNIAHHWGDLSAEEMVHRFWEGAISGSYVGHGETYSSEDEVLWWSKGGVLHGQSVERLKFLREVLEENPAGLEPIFKWQRPEYAGQGGEYYLVYFGKNTPTEWPFVLPRTKVEDGMTFEAEIIDTWNMTVEKVPGTFTIKRRNMYFWDDENKQSITLPGRPWLALRIRRVAA